MGWYDNNTSYTTGNVVYYQTGSFVCIAPTQIKGVPPALKGVDNNWLMLGNLAGVFTGDYHAKL